MATNDRALEGFFVSLGFDIDDEGLTEMADKVRATTHLMGTMVGLITGPVAAGLGLFVSMTARSMEALDDFATAEGVAAEAVQELGFAASVSGSSIDAVKNSISGLNRVTGEAALGVGRGRQLFQKLGLSAKDASGQVKGFDALIGEVADKMQGMSLQESIALASKLGIDNSMVTLLRQGGDALEELRTEARELGVMSNEQVKIGATLGVTMTRWQTVLSAIKNEIAVGLMPAATEIVTEMKEWLLVNRKLLQANLGLAIRVFTGILGQAWEWARAFTTTMIDLVRWLLQFKIVLYAVIAATGIFISMQVARVFGVLMIAVVAATRALWAFNFAATLVPALIGAIIIAVGLLIDDFFVWKEGGESLLGELLGGFPQVVEELKKFFSPLTAIINFFSKALDAAVNFGNYIKNTLLGFVTDLWDKIGGFLGIGDINIGAKPSSLTEGPAPLAQGGLLGSSATSIVNKTGPSASTTIGELTLNITSPDPSRAGESVLQELEKRNYLTTRHGQSQVVL